MAIPLTGYYYDQQLTRYMIQFMAIFTGLQVKTGNPTTSNQMIQVPIHYGHKDRVVAGLVSQNIQNVPLRLPVLGAHLKNIQMAEHRMKGISTERRSTFVPVGGLIPNDMKVIHQRMPVPYDLSVELNVYASNTDQHWQILEQILPLFDPQLQVQTSDAPFDWTKITCVTLKDINMEHNHPIGTDRRIIQSSLVFEMPVWIDTPADVRKDFIEQIYLRIGMVSMSDATNYDIIAELDAEGVKYDLVATDGDLPFK